MSEFSQDVIYQRIGEFVVSFQWLETTLREIGWYILDPSHENWPPTGLRNLTNHDLVEKVAKLFREALPKCDLEADHEAELLDSFENCVKDLHEMRKVRNRFLHSAYIEMKAGGEVQGILRSNPQLGEDEETGEPLFDQELLAEKSFQAEMAKMGEMGMFLGICHRQLIHRYKI